MTLLLQSSPMKSQDATSVFDALRMIKSPDEQAFIRDAGKRANLAIEATHKRMRAGMSESEVERILEEEFANQGTRGGGALLAGRG